MSQKTFNTVSGIIFSAIFVLHGLRALFGWEATINEFTIPVGFSIMGMLVSGVLAGIAFRFK